MGALYDIELYINCKDTDKVVQLAAAYAESAKKWAVIDPFDNFDGMLKAFFTDSVYETADSTYMASFNASYGWESVMLDMFRSIAPALNDGSWIKIWPDHGMDFMKVVNGRIEENGADEDEEEQCEDEEEHRKSKDNGTYDVVLLEKPDDEGLTKKDVLALYDLLKSETGVPVEIDNPLGTSTAMGFIAMEAGEKLNWNYDSLNMFVGRILSDMNLEREDHTYRHQDLVIWLTR